MNAPLECIIRKCENSTVDWKEGMSGNRSVIFREQDFKETGKQDFMNQLMKLEKEGLLKVKWYQYGTEAEKVWYRLEQMETIYQRLGKTPKFKRVNALKEEVDRQLALIQSQWIRSYYQSFLRSLDKGDVPKALDTPNLQPYLMDTQTHKQYNAYGEPIETSKLEKLQRTTEPLDRKSVV